MKRKLLIGSAVAAVAVAGAVAGGALAFAGGTDDEDTSVTGPEADRAGEVAVAEAGGGTASSVEREEEGGTVTWEVEVTKAEGTKVDVDLDASYAVVASDADGDEVEGTDDESDETDSSEPEADDTNEADDATNEPETDDTNEPDDDVTTTTG